MLDESYIRLFNRIQWKNKKARIKRYRDGEHRRMRLFADACVIRRIKPSISFGELLFNLVFRRITYYDNTDGVLSDKYLIEKTKDVLKLSVEKLQKYHGAKHGKFKTDPAFCREHQLKRLSYCRKVQRMINHESIGQWYDTSKSINENLKWAKQNGMKVCDATLRRFCKENGIETSPKRIDIQAWYDIHKTVSANLKYAMENGIQVSRSTLYKFVNSLRNQSDK